MPAPHRVILISDDDSTSPYSTAMSSVTASIYTSSLQHPSHSPGPMDLLVDHDDVLYGRDLEVKLLQEAFARVKNGTSTSEILFVHGPSGTGKTILVDSALRNHASSKHSIFLYGKYDQMQLTGNTCSGISSALSDLCELLLSDSDSHDDMIEIRQGLRDKLGSEAKALMRLVPNLHYLLPEIGSHQCSDTQRGSQGFTRLIQLCCTFLQIIIRTKGTLVIFLDDIQWADHESVNVMKSLADINNVLLVGAFRDNDESKVNSIQNANSAEEQNLTDLIDSIYTPIQNKATTRSEIISLGNLDIESINLKISHLTKMPDKETRELSEVIFQKTMGNAFSVRQFLERLLRTGMLMMDEGGEAGPRDRGGNTWRWDLDRIRSETDVSENVLLLVTKKIKGLRQDVQEVLQVAAFLGYRFDPTILEMVVQSAATPGDTADPELVSLTDASNRTFKSRTVDDSSQGTPMTGDTSLITQLINNVDSSGLRIKAHHASSASTVLALTSSALTIAMKEKLVEKASGESYKFSHDRVQQALHAMVGEETKLKLNSRIGRLLLNRCNEESVEVAARENLLLLAVDNLNLGSSAITARRDLIELARQNAKASKAAVSRLAFGSAAKYLEKALSILENDDDSDAEAKWQKYYDLSLDVVSTSAYVNHCLTNHQESYSKCQEVVRNARTLEDTFEVNKTLVLNAWDQEGGLQRGLHEGFGVLEKVGERFPVNPTNWHILAEAIKVKRALNGKTDEDLISLPCMTDKNKLHAMDIMGSMLFIIFTNPDASKLFALFGLRMMYITCRYGHAKRASMFAFAIYGALNGVKGNVTTCQRFLRIVESLSEEASTEAKARSWCIAHLFVSHFVVPFSQVERGFRDACVAGMECGNIDFASASLANYTYSAVLSNTNLSEIADEGFYILKQVRDFGREVFTRLQVLFLQYTHNLMGWVDDPGKLTGDICDEDEFRTEVLAEGSAFLLTRLNKFRFYLAIDFDRFHTIKQDIVSFHRDTRLVFHSHFSIHQAVLMNGLGAFKLMHRSRVDRKIRYIARSCTKQAARFVKANVHNSKPVAWCLMAEDAAFQDRKAKAKITEAVKLYDSGIASARQLEILLFEGLINQRAGEVMIDVYNSVERGVGYLREAVRVYATWGADGKVSHLKAGPYGKYLENFVAHSSEIVVSR